MQKEGNVLKLKIIIKKFIIWVYIGILNLIYKSAQNFIQNTCIKFYNNLADWDS